MTAATRSGLAPLLRGVLRHRELTAALIRRELFGAFAGSALGLAWAFLLPLAQIAVYLTVFSLVFQIRFGEVTVGSELGYPVYLVAGLLPWMAWAQVLTSSPRAVVDNAALVRQAHFPLEVLPIRSVGTALVPHAVGLLVLLVWIGFGHGPRLGWLLLPLALLIQTVAMLGAASLLSALTVLIRDLRELLTLFVTIGIYLIPCFYTPEMIDSAPPFLAWGLALNPFTAYVHIYRDALFHGSVEHPGAWGVALGTALLLGALGARVFERLRGQFGNLV